MLIRQASTARSLRLDFEFASSGFAGVRRRLAARLAAEFRDFVFDARRFAAEPRRVQAGRRERRECVVGESALGGVSARVDEVCVASAAFHLCLGAEARSAHQSGIDRVCRHVGRRWPRHGVDRRPDVPRAARHEAVREHANGGGEFAGKRRIVGRGGDRWRIRKLPGGRQRATRSRR